jgi:hypothetical protein
MATATTTHERPSQTESPQSGASMRILCLHDAGSTATKLKDQLAKLGQRLYERHGIDLVYVNSPLTVESDAEDKATRRVWWEEIEEIRTHNQNEPLDSFPTASRKREFRGLDASLLLLRQVWTSCPMQGVLGIGQGAAMASILALLPNLPTPPRFCVFVDGAPLLPGEERLSESRFPCLHLIHDLLHRQHRSDRLVVQFGGQVHHFSTPSGQLGQEEHNAIGRFLVSQKRDGPNQSIVALQTALHVVEQEAADKIAAEIARDPPASLMAVIRPQTVAGWSGNKRRQPDEEGGGAPCPSEFLLKRDKRPEQPGASRLHPSQANGT